MATRIPITKDSFGFEENRSKIWEDMERDMESRRREWEQEIEKMSSDFFTMRPEADRKFDSIGDKFGMVDRAAHVAPMRDEGKPVIEKDERGNPVFKVRFNVSDYKPDEVNVKMDSNKMQVHARHESKDGGKSVSREFSREINIPREIDPMSLQCSISKEGVLCVEAPFPAPQYAVTSGQQQQTPSYQQHQPQQQQQHQQYQTTVNVAPKYQSQPPPPQSQPYQQTSNYTPPPSYQSHHQPPPPHSIHQERSNQIFQQQHQQSPIHSMQSPPGAPFQHSQGPQHQIPGASPSKMGNTTAITIQKDTKFKLEIDIEDFAPEELTVKTLDKKVVVSGRREIKEAHRSSTKELSREYNIPDTVDPLTVKAFFTDGGRLIVEAPFKYNTNGGSYH